MKLALIGKNISHSKSKQIYQSLIPLHSYDLLDYDSTEVIPELSSLASRYTGVSITAPYKEYCFERCIVDAELQALRAVNCIQVRDGKLYGTNTDYLACRYILEKVSFERIVVLGDGAMSRVVIACTTQDVIQLSRKQASLTSWRLYDQKDTLFINACAREFIPPVPEYASLWDLNYAQAYEHKIKDKLMDRFENGERLLLEQAKFALKFWKME